MLSLKAEIFDIEANCLFFVDDLGSNLEQVREPGHAMHRQPLLRHSSHMRQRQTRANPSSVAHVDYAVGANAGVELEIADAAFECGPHRLGCGLAIAKAASPVAQQLLTVPQPARFWRREGPR